MMEADYPKIKLQVPQKVREAVETLKNKGFSAYIVGGSVRDLLMGRAPKDWDLTTSAKPEEIAASFVKTFYENDYGTVTVVNEETEDQTLRNIEITPYRLEAKYSDQRHPDEVTFSEQVEDDLKRRDFTVNAIAYDPVEERIIDLYGGIKDIKDKIIKTVGNPDERFGEDALRIMRAVRLATELGFTLNKETFQSMVENSGLIKNISIERVRDELVRIIMSPEPMNGLILSHRTGILRHILPELEEGIDMEQNGDHIYTVWEHTLRVVQHSADRNFPLHVRLAALFHDIGKPRTRQWSEEKNDWIFYGHDALGGKLTKKILERLRFSNKIIETVGKLVKNHMFFTDTDQITLSAVRRMIVKVGQENIWDLMNLRACDRIGMGRPKEEPYRLRKYESMIEEALRAPTSVGMLKIDGQRLMEVTRETPSPRIGFILHALLEEALEDPNKNTKEYLEKRALELAKLKDKELKELGEKGKEKKEEVEEEELKKIRSKYKVK